MNQHQIDENKLTIKSFDERIKDLEGRLNHMKLSKQGFIESIVNYELNCADSAHRVCCGSKPRAFAFSAWECNVSPISSCVYMDEKDPTHTHCLFCNEPEKRQ